MEISRAVRKKIAKAKASETTLDPETDEAREAAESAAAGRPATLGPRQDSRAGICDCNNGTFAHASRFIAKERIEHKEGE
jgi:hypothetical protein